ncbi:TPA: hypothetical protein ACXI7E_000464 [Pseudomonas aeruginosa]
MSNELTDVRCPCGAESQADSYDAGFIAGSGMCQNCGAALPPKDICTCPSGDGSLRWPCPKHPAVEQAGTNVGHGHVFPRADGVKMRCGCPGLCSECTADASRARAALAQPSLMPPDRGPWHAVKWDGGRRVDLSSDDFEHDVALTVSGDFVEGDKFRYAQELAAWMNAHLAQPSPAQAEKAEAERPIVSFEKYMQVMYDRDENAKRLDAALARVAGLETALSSALSQHGVKFMDPPDGGDTPLIEQVYRMSQALSELEKQEPVATIAKVPGEDWNGLHFYRDLQGMQPGTKLYAAPVAQAQHSVPEEFIGRLSEFLAQRGATGKALLRELRDMLAAAPGKEVPQAWLDVQAERKRQVEAEGWTPEHDDEHADGQMAQAAGCYALHAGGIGTDWPDGRQNGSALFWPWDKDSWKPTTPRRDLVKACALALAEIERLDRAGISQSPQPGATTASS